MFGTTEAVIGAGRSNAGRLKLAIRLMARLLYLKHGFNLSDEELVVRWSENIVWQFFSGMACYERRLPCDATQIGRFRRDLGEEGLELLLKETIDTAVTIEAIKPKDIERVIVDTGRRQCQQHRVHMHGGQTGRWFNPFCPNVLKVLSQKYFSKLLLRVLAFMIRLRTRAA